MPPLQRPVSDLLIVIGGPPETNIARLLADRPGLADSQIIQRELGWGTVWVQHPFEYGATNLSVPDRIFVGRPVVRRSVHGADASPAELLEQLTSLDEHAERLSESLSGMFALFEFTGNRFSILTDRMGFRPVYVGHDSSGRVRSIGTHAESVAIASGTGSCIDPVSLAELLVHNDITFPFTTRTTMRELPPAALTTLGTDSNNLSSRILWEPIEPESFPPKSTVAPRIAHAMREAARDITRDCNRIGVLLSGGADSRAVLGAVLESVEEPERITGLTYVTRENNETRVAARVAEAGGCNHELVHRDEHYFPGMLRRGLSLLGCELRGNCHGLGIADNRLADRFDVIIGGQLSDTMLKDHFVDIGTRAGLRTPTMKQRLRQAIPGLRRPLPVSPPGHTTGRSQLEPILVEEICLRVQQRRRQRLEDVQRIRPKTGAVWHRFWPCSRQDDSAHTLGNTRIAISDTLFAHSAIVEIASDLSLEARLDGAPANAAISAVCGPLTQIENANTGLPIDATGNEVRSMKKQRTIRPGTSQAMPDDDAPWNAVDTSWVDPKVMQQRSPMWIQAREQLSESAALRILDDIVERGGAALIGTYQNDLPSNINHIAVQIALWLDGVCAGEPIKSDELPQPTGSDSR